MTALYERHGSRVLRFCRQWLRSREEAEDATQTTFLNAFRGLERGIVPTNEAAWLLAIARNVCLARADAVRRRAIEVPRDPHTLDELVAVAAEANELEGLDEAFAALTEQQRRAVFLREWHGLSYREIAETLALSQAAVETLLFRARRTLARHVRRPLGIGSFAPWLRSLAEGVAGKVALGAAAVAVTAATGTLAIAPGHRQMNAPRVTHGTTVQATVASPPLRVRAPQPTPPVRRTTRALAPVVPPVAVTPSPVAATTPAAAPVTAAAPAPSSDPATPAPTLPSPVQTTGADAIVTVDAVAPTAAGTVDQAATDAAGTAADVTATVQQTTQAVATVVTTIVDPHGLLP